MKIALVCSEVIAESGHGRYMLELARRLVGRHEVHVFAHLYQPIPGVIHHPVWAHVGVNLFRTLTFWWGATRALRGQSFDIVHSIGGACARQNVVTAQFCQRSWGARLQQLMLLDRAAERAGAPPVLGAPGWRQAYHTLYWRVADRLEAAAFHAGSGRRLIAVSGSVREELVADYGVPREAIAVIPNGVEPEDFLQARLLPFRAPTRERHGINSAARVVLFVGEFFRKGLSAAVQALAALARPDVHLLVVGRGPQAVFAALAERLGVASQVHFVGFVPDPRPYFSAADVFLFPTLYEPFGMVVLEAMAAGLPVITTRLAGVADVICAGEEGYLVADPLDVEAYAQALRDIFADPAQAARMGSAARLAAQRASWDQVAAQTEAIYHTLKT